MDNDDSSEDKDDKKGYDSEPHYIFRHYTPPLNQELDPWIVELSRILKLDGMNNKEARYQLYCEATIKMSRHTGYKIKFFCNIVLIRVLNSYIPLLKEIMLLIVMQQQRNNVQEEKEIGQCKSCNI